MAHIITILALDVLFRVFCVFLPISCLFCVFGVFSVVCFGLSLSVQFKDSSAEWPIKCGVECKTLLAHAFYESVDDCLCVEHTLIPVG